MIVKNGLRFNCCESVLLKIHEEHPLPGFDDATMRIASNLGGGVAGWGDICGALLGGAMAIGLIYGTDGDETPPTFDEERLKERKITLELIKEFKTKWRHVGCCDLLGCRGCTPEERTKRGEDLKARGESHCDEYVDWTVAETLAIIKKTK
ncbi:MAG: C-GCAxxG-C-C family protein [Candidatus Bathyarchaeota archaeon]|nr:C-GCAxxG-C-C family protein [Candidatus Bathyarchaeota archaeon]